MQVVAIATISIEDGRPAPAQTLRWRQWFVDMAEEKSTVCSSNPKLRMTLKGQTEAHLYGPRDGSAHVRSRWLFDRTTAMPPKHVGPFHLRMCLQRWRSASDTQPPC